MGITDGTVVTYTFNSCDQFRLVVVIYSARHYVSNILQS